jgi:hypothetical protein
MSLCSWRTCGSGVPPRSFSGPLSGEYEVDRPLNRDNDVFNRKLGWRNVLVMVFDRLGTSVLPLATNVCDGVSSGCSPEVVEDLSSPAIGIVTPGMLTPPTCRASNGPEIVNVRGLVIAVLAIGMKGNGATSYKWYPG